MKILMVTRDVKDGIGTTVKNLVAQYEQRSDVELITVVCPEKFAVKTDKVKFLKAEIRGHYFFTKVPYFAYMASKVINKELRETKYDIVHLHSNILNYKFLKKTSKIISTFQGTHRALLNLNVAVVSTFHSTHKAVASKMDFSTLKYSLGKYLHKLFIYLDNLRVKNSDLITCVSKFTMKELIEDSKLPKEKFVYVPNGINMEIYRPAEFNRRDFLKHTYKIDVGSKKVLLYIGRLETGKGVNVLAEAVKDMDAILLIAGVGPERKKLESYQNIKCLGYVSNEVEKNLLINACDVFVLPSFYENFPTVIPEAMAAGKAIVSTKVGMVPEILQNRSAALAEINSVESLKNKITAMLNNEDLRLAEAHKNLDYARLNLDWKKVSDHYINLYNILLKNMSAQVQKPKTKKAKQNLFTGFLARVFMLVLVLIPIVIGAIVLFRFLSPFGLLVRYDFNIANNAELFGRIRNVNRVAEAVVTGNKLEITDKFEVTKEKIEFSIEPIVDDFKNMKFNIELGEVGNLSTLLQLNNFETKNTENTLIKNSILDQLGPYDYRYNDYMVWSFNDNLNTLANLESKIRSLGLSSETINTCTLGNLFYIEPGIRDVETYSAPKIYSQILRGPHIFDTYVAENGILYFSFEKKDLNWYSGADELSVKVSKEGKVVKFDIVADDGIYDGKFGRALSNSQSYVLDMKNLESGVYEIAVNTTDDVLLDRLSSKNSKIVVSKDLFLANNSIYGVETNPVNIYTFANRVFVSSYHDASKQIVSVNKTKYTLESLQNFESLELGDKSINEIIFSEGDVRISSKDYFGLDSSSYFKPSVIDQIDCLTFPLDVIRQQDILVVKNLATRQADGSYEINIPFNKNYIGPDGKLYFTIYSPGLGADEQKVEIKRLSVEMSK